MKLLRYLGAAAFLWVFFWFFREKPITWSNKSEYICHQIDRKIAQKICKEKNVSWTGVGGSIQDTIRKQMLAFALPRPISFDEGRQLVLEMVEIFVKEANSHPEWVPYYTEYPIAEHTPNIEIFIRNPNYAPLPEGALSAIWIKDATLIYFTAIPKIQPHDPASDIAWEETYEEALAIACSQGRAPKGAPCDCLSGGEKK